MTSDRYRAIVLAVLLADDLVSLHHFRRLFASNPETRAVLGFNEEKEPVQGDKGTSIHAHTVISMFDSVFQILGPDIDVVEEVLVSLSPHFERGWS